MDIYDLADLYADQLIQSSDFIRLLELKELIKKELSKKLSLLRRQKPNI